jgi:hypothetical protein
MLVSGNFHSTLRQNIALPGTISAHDYELIGSEISVGLIWPLTV